MFCSSSRPARVFRQADWCPPQTRTDGHTCKTSAVRMRAEHTGAQRLSQMDNATRVDCDTSAVVAMKVRGHCLRWTVWKGVQSGTVCGHGLQRAQPHNCNQEWNHTQLTRSYLHTALCSAGPSCTHTALTLTTALTHSACPRKRGRMLIAVFASPNPA